MTQSAESVAALKAENIELRQALAYAARVVEAQTDLKAIKGDRRLYLDKCIKDMRTAAIEGFHPWRHAYRFSGEFERLYGKHLKRLIDGTGAAE